MGRRCVVGVDPSLTGFALCCFYQPEEGKEITGPVTRRLTSKPAKGLYDRMDRFRALRTEAMNEISRFGEPVAIFVEGYSYASQGQAVLDIAEFGGIFREALCRWRPSIVREVAPNLLKQFATEKGNSKKEFVMAHVSRRWGLIFNSNDECDAYVLARMAAVGQGWIKGETLIQRNAVRTVIEGKTTAA